VFDPLLFGPPVVGFTSTKADGNDSLHVNAGGAATASSMSRGAEQFQGRNIFHTDIRADSGVVTGAAGRAAGESIDSVLLQSGTYGYSFIIQDIQLSAQRPQDIASVDLYGTDSRFDQPITWHVAISAHGPIESPGDLAIDVNSGVNLNDQLIEDTLRASFEVSAGTAFLRSPYFLFSLTYVPDRATTLGTGVGAGVVSVPEPTQFVLMLCGLALLARPSFLFAVRKRRDRFAVNGRTE